MDLKTLLEYAFAIIILGDILMHANAFSSVIGSASASYNGLVTTFQGR